MDDHDITSFIDQVQDGGQFAGRGTQEAAATAGLLAQRRAGWVEDWLLAAVTALRDGMREDHQPPVARALLQTPQVVIATEAEPCCETGWFVDGLKRRAAGLPDVWVAFAVPDTAPSNVSISHWNPTNISLSSTITEMRWFVEVRGRRLGLGGGKLLRTGRAALDLDPVNTTAAEDPGLLRLGRRVLRGHPVRRR